MYIILAPPPVEVDHPAAPFKNWHDKKVFLVKFISASVWPLFSIYHTVGKQYVQLSWPQCSMKISPK